MSSMHLGAEHTSVLEVVCKTAERNLNQPKQNELRTVVVTHMNSRKKFSLFGLEK